MLKTFLEQGFAHGKWADERILEAMSNPDFPVRAKEIFAHVLMTPIVWSARVESLTPRPPLWPNPADFDFKRGVKWAHDNMKWLIDDFGPEYDHEVAYENTKGEKFTNTVSEILLQLLAHGHYHRGQINLLLRQAGIEPVIVEFIVFARS